MILFVDCFSHGNTELNFSRTSCIICVHGTYVVEVFNILQLVFFSVIVLRWSRGSVLAFGTVMP